MQASSQASNRSGDASSVKIPPLPTTFAEVVQLYRGGGGEGDPRQLVSIVQRDAAVSSYVLKVVNSAYFGLQREVSQIERAITLLGFEPVCNVVLSVGLREAFGRLDDARLRVVYEHVMKTSLATATFARELALVLEPRIPDTVFAAGIVHQIGRLVLLFSGTARYAGLWQFYREEEKLVLEPPLPADERGQFGTDYVDVGARVATEWSFPKLLRTGIAHHRQPDRERGTMERPVAFMVASAHQAAQALYGRETGPGGRFFGMSAPLAALARSYDRPPVDLITVLADKRDEVRTFADSIVGEKG